MPKCAAPPTSIMCWATTSAVRVNVMGQRNNIDGQPFARNQRWGIAPAIAFGLGTDTVWTLKYLHQQQDDIPDTGVPFLFGQPAPVPKNAFYGLPSDDRYQTDVEIVTGKVEHKINDIFSVSDTVRYGSYWYDARETNAHYGTANCYTAAPYAGAPLCASTANPVPVTTFNPLFPGSRHAAQPDLRRARPAQFQGHRRHHDE